MKKTSIGIGVVIVVVTIVVGFIFSKTNKNPTALDQLPSEKIYVALEGEGKIAVVDAGTNKLLRKIDLSEEQGGMSVDYMAHNVQVAPDGSSVAVTANIGHEHMQMDMPMGDSKLVDQVIIIDPRTDTITKRIPVEQDSHLAHVIYTQDSRTVWVTLQSKDKVAEISLDTGTILKSVYLGAKSEPHGLRLSPDGTKAFIALMSGTGIITLDTQKATFEKKEFSSPVVQTAVTTDGDYLFGSLYSTKQITWVSLDDGSSGFINLPKESKGPVQLYPTPDSKYLYVADQGYYFNQPKGDRIYRINISDKKVDATIIGGTTPHGVVVNRSGTRIYVSNLLSGDMSVIDSVSNSEIARIPVGAMPNGVSIWHADLGGTP